MAQNNYDLESSEFKNQNIRINSDNIRDINTGEGKYGSSGGGEVESAAKNEKGEDIVQQQKEAIAQSMMQKATEHVTKSWIEKYLCCLDFLKKYFNVTSDDVRRRFLHSLVPFNPKFHDISEKTPDLYGPFWIYTTLIFIIAAAGSLAKYLQAIPTKNFFQEFVPIAAGIIYGVGFGLPLILTISMKIFGSGTSFISVLCTYGYSFSIFIPIIIACSAPFSLVQWILLGYAIFSSTSLLIVNYWKELSKYIDKKRYFLVIVILIVQAGLYLLLKLYFFERLTQEITVNPGNSTNTNTTNSTNSTNSTLLF